jgi:hypothetical protein
MSEEQQPQPIREGDPVVITRPQPKADGRQRLGCEPGCVIIILVVIFVLITFSPQNCSGPAPVVTPLPPVGASPLPGVTPPTLGTQPGPVTPIGCQPGIAVGATANVIYPQVRMRWSAGYVGKNDATDSKKYMTTGDQVRVIGGPEMRDGLCWWLIEFGGEQGWTADHSREGRQLLSAGP